MVVQLVAGFFRCNARSRREILPYGGVTGLCFFMRFFRTMWMTASGAGLS
jgi:hypothetical protein